MKRYRTDKIIEAGPIYKTGMRYVLLLVETPEWMKRTCPGTTTLEEVEVPDSFYVRGKPSEGDYLVRYPAVGDDPGGTFWMSKQAFEAACVPVPDEPMVPRAAAVDGLLTPAQREDLMAGKPVKLGGIELAQPGYSVALPRPLYVAALEDETSVKVVFADPIGPMQRGEIWRRLGGAARQIDP